MNCGIGVSPIIVASDMASNPVGMLASNSVFLPFMQPQNGPVSIPLVFGCILLAIPALVGLLLIFKGRARRIGSDPHCRKCDYLLIGINPDRCPECGSPLNPQSVIHGQRRRRRLVFYSGWALVLLTVGALLAPGFWDQLRRVNWYQHIPTFLIARDLKSALPDLPLKAFLELQRRDQNHDLSSAYRAKLANFALAQQTNTGDLSAYAVNYLGQRILAGDLSPDQKTKFIHQCVVPALSVRRAILCGEKIPYDPDTSQAHFPFMRNWSAKMFPSQIAIDGAAPEPILNSVEYTDNIGLSCRYTTCEITGPHMLTVTFHKEIGYGNLVVGSEDQILHAPFTVYAALPPSDQVTLQNRPDLAEPLKDCIDLEVAFNQNNFHFFSGQIRYMNIPCDTAFDVLAGYNGKEFPLGWIYTRKGERVTTGFWTHDSTIPPPPATIDVIFRPDPAVARKSVDCFNIWGDQLVYHDVPVTEYPTK
jgi:hypothetical protein